MMCSTVDGFEICDDDSQNKLLQINYCEEEYYPLHVYMICVQFEEFKTKALLLITLLLSKFVVSLVAS